jgi:hypothetical protein
MSFTVAMSRACSTRFRMRAIAGVAHKVLRRAPALEFGSALLPLQ